MNLYRLLEHKIRQRRDLMMKHYSQPLVDLVLSLLDIDEKRRPSFSQILSNPMMRAYCPKISLSNGHEQRLDTSRASNFTPCTSYNK